MKIKEQTRKLAVGCSKHCFEVVDGTDVVSILHIRQGDADAVRRVLVQNSGLIVSLKHKKPTQWAGSVCIVQLD